MGQKEESVKKANNSTKYIDVSVSKSNTKKVLAKEKIIKPERVNDKIFKLLENYINPYTATINNGISGNGAIYQIFDSFLQHLRAKTEGIELRGIDLESVIVQNLPVSSFYIPHDSFNKEGISMSFIFDNERYFIKFLKYRDGDTMRYETTIKSQNTVKYSFSFIYKYLLYNALELSNLKGSYFTMPRDSFDWEIRTLEERTFDDIYLPKDITEDLKLYAQIFNKSGRILRYLKVGPPGVGKTESTIVLANELNNAGVTIIKTPICKALHDKVELANVLAPALIIFDDIDLSLGDRNKGAYSQLLGDFLDVMDGTDKLSKDVGVIATTNAAHLLDLAAQRPGRFDKTLLFEDITHENIKNIILKSLRNNFNVVSGKEINTYGDKKIVSAFYDAKVTGSHVYNSIKMLKLRYDTLEIKDVTVARILDGIKNEIDVIKKVRKITHLKETLDRETGNIGFGYGNTSYEEEGPSPEMPASTGFARGMSNNK